MSECSLVNNCFGFTIFKLCKNVYLPTFSQKCLPLYISLKIGLVYNHSATDGVVKKVLLVLLLIYETCAEYVFGGAPFRCKSCVLLTVVTLLEFYYIEHDYVHYLTAMGIHTDRYVMLAEIVRAFYFLESLF